jgi:casein kinase II subunit beta
MWIDNFCRAEGHEVFCKIDGSYLSDNFNLYGLRSQVPYYSFALKIILDCDLGFLNSF